MINKDTKIYGSFSSTPGNNGCLFFNEKFNEDKINAIYKSFYSNDIKKSIEAAKTLAGLVTDKELSKGQLYPSLSDIRNVSKKIAINVAKKVISSGLSITNISDDLEKHLDKIIYYPEYQDYI